MSTEYYRFLLSELEEVYKVHRHIGIKVESNWGTKDCHHYLCELLNKSRERKGFSLILYQRLLLIYLLHVQQYGDFCCPVSITNPNLQILSDQHTS